jgi:hypothetical protein
MWEINVMKNCDHAQKFISLRFVCSISLSKDNRADCFVETTCDATSSKSNSYYQYYDDKRKGDS